MRMVCYNVIASSNSGLAGSRARDDQQREMLGGIVGEDDKRQRELRNIDEVKRKRQKDGGD